MNKFAAKAIGIALAVPMVLGGAIAYADEAQPEEEIVPGYQVFQRDYYVSGTLPAGAIYYRDTDTFAAPVSGTYYFVTSDEDDNYAYAVRSVQPEFTINGVKSNNPGDYWGCNSVVYLEAGEYSIDWQGRLPGWFTLTGTLLSADGYCYDLGTPTEFVSSDSDSDSVPVDDEDDETPAGDDTPVTNVSDSVITVAVPVDLRIASVKNFIGHIYLEGLGRECDPEAMDLWLDMIVNQNVTGTQVATMILTSDEFEDKDLTDEEFASVVNDVFGIENADDSVVEQLSDGVSRASVIEQLAETSDWASKCAFYCVNA